MASNFVIKFLFVASVFGHEADNSGNKCESTSLIQAAKRGELKLEAAMATQAEPVEDFQLRVSAKLAAGKPHIQDEQLKTKVQSGTAMDFEDLAGSYAFEVTREPKGSADQCESLLLQGAKSNTTAGRWRHTLTMTYSASLLQTESHQHTVCGCKTYHNKGDYELAMYRLQKLVQVCEANNLLLLETDGQQASRGNSKHRSRAMGSFHLSAA